MSESSNLPEPSYIELKTLWRLHGYSAPLVCKGSFWTFESEPTFSVAFDTVRRLHQWGWIRPCQRDPDHRRDDWEISECGMTAVKANEEHFSKILEQHVDWIASRIYPKSERATQPAAPRGVVLADYKGVWLSH